MADRWIEFPHIPQRERGLVMQAGECLQLPALTAPREPILWMRCLRGVPQISDDGLDVEVWCACDGGEAQRLLSHRLDNTQTAASLRELSIDLPVPLGCQLRIEVRCGAGPLGQPSADWLGLLGLVVCARDEFDLLRARTHHAWRLQNEIAHFSQVYSNDFYSDRHTNRRASVDDSSPRRAMPSRSVDQGVVEASLRAALHDHLRCVEPLAGENAFAYANRMLAMVIPAQAPDFPGRLRALSAQHPDRPLRMLALCAGEAAIEGSILEAAGVPVELCIVDVNAGLLDQAVMHMPTMVTVDRVLGDANDIGPQLGKFDVVNITSGLHHLVELERVLAAIAEILSPGGEFWLIGEQVGRNGNRLWPEAWEIANRIFAAWPASKRTNHNTGRVDAEIPDTDFSAGCFEGIRSQDIIGQLERHFLPVNCYVRNAFLWRLADVAYAANFDLNDRADRELLMRAATEEAMHWAQGGRGTEMHAVYRSKRAGLLGLLAETHGPH
ncbi:class I SAM-dependent methyltransferase [Rhodanobacter sp. C03]|uniref:class I SAM-dependent methyltransferase n=1 Tax=Rhodanobacter sp. C03 TaxID=1945858 RepID=UPI00143BC443|nr:class I SAM-dependent methyltransferase [Rhodanobacter sp. C03]